MRLSTSMLYNMTDTTILRRRLDMATSQEQIASGRRINSLADDPIGVRHTLREESRLRATESHRRTVDGVSQLLGQSDDALADVTEAVQRAHELAVQMSNDTYSAEDRRAAAEEVVQLRGRLVELANTKVNGRYLFGGLANAAQPFDAAGVHAGDTGQFTVPVGGGVTLEASLPGGEPFTDPLGGPSVFTTLDNLETALRADNGTAVRAEIDNLINATDRVADARQAIGHQFERIENVNSAFDRAELAANATLAGERDTDLASAVLSLQQSETGLRMALAMASRIGDLNLANFFG